MSPTQHTRNAELTTTPATGTQTNLAPVDAPIIETGATGRTGPANSSVTPGTVPGEELKLNHSQHQPVNCGNGKKTKRIVKKSA